MIITISNMNLRLGVCQQYIIVMVFCQYCWVYLSWRRLKDYIVFDYLSIWVFYKAKLCAKFAVVVCGAQDGVARDSDVINRELRLMLSRLTLSAQLGDGRRGIPRRPLGRFSPQGKRRGRGAFAATSTESSSFVVIDTSRC